LQAELESNLEDGEAALLGQLVSQNEYLMNEKKQVEEKNHKELENAIEGKNKELELQLREQKEQCTVEICSYVHK
jgi:hypothetical protein